MEDNSKREGQSDTFLARGTVAAVFTRLHFRNLPVANPVGCVRHTATVLYDSGWKRWKESNELRRRDTFESVSMFALTRTFA